jgi:hypothetical protein
MNRTLKGLDALVLGAALVLAGAGYSASASAQSTGIGASLGGTSANIGGSRTEGSTDVDGNAASVGNSNVNFNLGQTSSQSTANVNLGRQGSQLGDATLGFGGLDGMNVGSIGQTGAPADSTFAASTLGATTPAGIAAAFDRLSASEQKKLTTKCVSVMAAPGRFGNDLVALCKIVASL